MRIEWQVAVFCTLSCCFCGLINRKRVMIGQLDCSSLLTRVGFAHIYLEAWLRWSVMLQEICSSWLLCWLWLPRYRAILRKKNEGKPISFQRSKSPYPKKEKVGTNEIQQELGVRSIKPGCYRSEKKKKQDKQKLQKFLYTSGGYIWKSLTSLVFSRCF